MDDLNRAYFERRIFQEKEAARMATSLQARERHEELAEAYRFRCMMNAELSAEPATPLELERAA